MREDPSLAQLRNYRPDLVLRKKDATEELAISITIVRESVNEKRNMQNIKLARYLICQGVRSAIINSRLNGYHYRARRLFVITSGLFNRPLIYKSRGADFYFIYIVLWSAIRGWRLTIWHFRTSREKSRHVVRNDLSDYGQVCETQTEIGALE